MMSPPFSRATGFVHQLLRDADLSGSLVVDATCGRGHDTVALAKLVGEGGRVLAMDLQDEAIQATTRRLQAEGLLERVRLTQIDHARLSDCLAEEAQPPAALVFNLGYLPGGDKRVITRVESTLTALEQAYVAVVPGGMITVAVYSGHTGGAEEAIAVQNWMECRPQSEAEVVHYRFVNQRNDPPSVYGLRKLV